MNKMTIASSLMTFSLMLSGGSALAADHMKKGDMSKDGMKKEAMAKDGMKKEDMAKDSMKKDEMKKGRNEEVSDAPPSRPMGGKSR